MGLLEEIIKKSGLHPSRIFNVYLFGSRVYQTSNSNSDWDVIIVANNSVESTEIINGLYNIHIYTPDKFKSDLDWHRPNNLECIFAPDWAKLKETIDYKKDFKLNIPKLRHATSHVSSNSWVKSLKKINSGEYYIGIKSLFHSLRITMFSIQIVEDNRIVDFSCANYIWDNIKSRIYTFDELDNEYRLLRNTLNSKFRKITNK
jgi:predicted nucleotidyltransferase